MILVRHEAAPETTPNEDTVLGEAHRRLNAERYETHCYDCREEWDELHEVR